MFYIFFVFLLLVLFSCPIPIFGGHQFIDSVNGCLIGFFMLLLVVCDQLADEAMAVVNRAIGPRKERKMSLKDEPNFLLMSPSCLSKPLTAALAFSVACGTSEVVLMFTSRD